MKHAIYRVTTCMSKLKNKQAKSRHDEKVALLECIFVRVLKQGETFYNQA